MPSPGPPAARTSTAGWPVPDRRFGARERLARVTRVDVGAESTDIGVDWVVCPQPYRGVVAAGGDGPAVRAEHHAVDRAGPVGERRAELAVARDVPDPDGVVVPGGRERPTVAAERHAV